MKKFVLSMAVALTILATACSTSTKTADAQADELKAKIENASGSQLDAYVQEAKAYADKLVKEGKLEEAKKYLDIIEPVVKEKAPQLAAAFDTVNSTLGRITSKATDAVTDAKETATEAATEAKEAVADKAEQTVAKANDAANQAVDKAADAANQAVGNVADKAKSLLK